MYNLSDRERELMLWLLCNGMGIREVQREAHHAKNTVLKFAENFSMLALHAGWKIAPEYRDFDQFQTMIRVPLYGKLRAPIPVVTPLPVLMSRAIMATARDRETAQWTIDSTFPLIRAAYWPDKRQAMLEAEARREGALAPIQCRHCGGTYGWKRHDEICVRFGLA